MKRIIQILVAVVLLAALAGGGYWLYQTYFVPAQTTARTFTQIVPVRQGTLSNTLSVVGELDAESNQDLTFSLMDGAAKLKTLTVAAGNQVKKGQVLATIDPVSYQQALDQAKSDLQAAEKTLADLQEPATPLEISQADLAIAQAEYELTKATGALDDLEHPDMAELQRGVETARIALAQAKTDLAAKQNNATAETELYDLQVAEATPAAEYNRLAAETYSDEKYQDRLSVAYNKMMDAQDARVTYELQQQQELLTAQTQVRTAQQTLVDAEQALHDAQSGGAPLELAQARLAVQDAQVALANAKQARVDLDSGADAVDIASAKASADQKRLAGAEAQAALAGTELKAPFDGTVLDTNVRVGSQVTASQVVLTLADLTKLNVIASVDETTIRRIRAGQNAEISFDAFPGQTFSGKILSVPLQGELQNDVMVYQVPLSLQGIQDLPVRVGMTANVNIETAQASNALLVPTIALQHAQGKYQVQLVNPTDPQGDPLATDVEVGLSDGTYTQILQGLNAGDQIVVTVQSTTNQNNTQPQGSFFIGGAPPPNFGGGNNNRQPGGGQNSRP